MKRLQNLVVFFLFTYPVGVLIGIGFALLESLEILEVLGWQNFPKKRGKILLVSNHPSLVEPVLLIGVFFHHYVFQPFKYGPWTLADRKNYCEKWWSWMIRPRIIPVHRTEQRGDSRSLVAAKKVMEFGANIILFPEGGRTFKGTDHLVSRGGKRIRRLKGGFAVLAIEPGVTVVPVWFEFDRWSSMRLTIGKLQNFNGMCKEEVIERTESILLELADAN